MPALSGIQTALMQARSGIARSGATRSDYYFGSLALTIGGVDRAQWVEKGTTKISDILNEQADTASLRTFGTAFTPSPGQEIVIGSGAINNRVFGGTIVRATQTSSKKAGQIFWQLECTDYTWLLNRNLVTKRYSAQAGNLIVADLISSFATGFTTASVMPAAPSTPDVIEFKATRLSEALTRVANLVGWNWYVDYGKDIHFFSTESSQAPATIDANNVTYERLEWRPAIDQIRTRILVEGGGGVTTSAVAVGATSIPVNECSWYSGSGGTVNSGSNLITYTGRSASSGPGNLTGVPPSGASSVQYAIKQGEDINVWVVVNDAAAQAALAALDGTDGVREHYVQDRRLSIDGATARANAELTLFKSIDFEGSYLSRDKFNKSGKSVVIDLPARGILSTVTLHRVVRRYEAQDRWVFDIEFQRIRRDFYDLLRHFQRGVEGS